LALKHRQSKNHKPRIVLFIASPVVVDQAELIKLAKRLKKEKVNVDIINFGEEEANNSILTEFISTLNGKEGTTSHLVSVAAPGNLSDALFSSQMFQGEDGSTLPAGFGPGFQYGMEDDPELAMALRISMEESRLKQEADAKGKTGETMDTDINQGKNIKR
jgi:26S proteasome regulatory subunit N10